MAEDNDWDPMEDDLSSYMNTPSFKIADSGIFSYGNQSLRTISCPFYDGETPGRCFKGTSCQYNHGQYSQKILAEHPKLAMAAANDSKSEIRHVSNMPQKELPSDNFVAFGWIINANDPWDFNVVLRNGWTCLCHGGSPEDAESGVEDFRNKTNFGHREWERLQVYMNRQRYQPHDYAAGELVAVKLTTESGSSRWFRAVVLESVQTEGSSDVSPEVNLKLLDIGFFVIKKTLDIVPLPLEFCRFPASVYKCQLYGISPVMGNWSAKTIQDFKTLVLGKHCIFIVKRTIYPEIDGEFGVFEKTPIQVEVRVKCNEFKSDVHCYKSVAETLIEEGKGLEWNAFLHRPFLNNVLPQTKYSYCLGQCANQEIEENILHEIYERENSRMEKFRRRKKAGL